MTTTDKSKLRCSFSLDVVMWGLFVWFCLEAKLLACLFCSVVCLALALFLIYLLFKKKKSKLIGSQVSGGNNTEKEKVPTGLFYMFGEGESPVFLLMDHHGEFFLIQKGKVHWSHKTNIKMYYLFVSDGVDDYIDAGEHMFSYRHTPGHRPEVISHGSLEDLRVKLEHIYGNGIRASSKLVKLDLDYQTGELSDESTSERFLISIIKYEVLLSSSVEPPTLRWHLVFPDVSAVFPNTDFPCMVLYAQNLTKFKEICQKFEIKKLPGGRNIDDLI